MWCDKYFNSIFEWKQNTFTHRFIFFILFAWTQNKQTPNQIRFFFASSYLLECVSGWAFNFLWICAAMRVHAHALSSQQFSMCMFWWCSSLLLVSAIVYTLIHPSQWKLSLNIFVKRMMTIFFYSFFVVVRIFAFYAVCCVAIGAIGLSQHGMQWLWMDATLTQLLTGYTAFACE